MQTIRLQQTNRTNRVETNHNTNIETDFQIDDDLLRELEEDFEDSSVQNYTKSTNTAQKTCFTNRMTSDSTKENGGLSKTNQNRRSDSPDLFEGMDIDDELLNDHLDQLETPKPQSVNKPNDEQVIVLDDSFSDIDIDSHLDRIDEEMSKLPTSTQRAQSFKPQLKNPPKKLAQSKLNFGSSATTSKNLPTSSTSLTSVKNGESSSRMQMGTEKSVKRIDTKSLQSTNIETSPKSCTGLPKVNVLSIEKLKSLIPNVGHGKFKIKGKFKEVKEKLTINASDIYMVITIKDDSGEIPAQIHSSIVETLANTTLKRLKDLRELTIQSDSKDAKKEILEVSRGVLVFPIISLLSFITFVI